jgi:membrane fusion protein, multidrug efflux system
MKIAHNAGGIGCQESRWSPHTRQLHDRLMAAGRGYPTLFVPATAVTSDQQRTYVIRVHNGKVEWVTVQTGQSFSGEIEVFGDLSAGDQVVKTASDAIHSGDPVRVQNQASTTK